MTDDAGLLLVVDDNEMNRDVLSRRLSRRGFEVLQAENGRRALEIVASEAKLDLVLLDVMMPDMSGIEVLKKIRQNRNVSELPVIMATAQDDSVESLESGANDFVTKPIRFPPLLARVRNHVAIKRLDGKLRAARDRAEEANRAKSTFLTNMSHELRTPLNSVIGFSKVMLKNKKGNLTASDLKYLDRICSNGTHLLGLINSILDLSKVEAGKMELELGDVDLAALIQETVDSLQGRLLERPIQLLSRVPDEATTVKTDADKLKQVMINLAGNSLKFTKEGSVTVALVVDGTGRPQRVDVIDTGIGIPADKLQTVFRAFQQADNSTRREYGGTGLGLAISRSLCDLMGYHITVSSTVGEGSVFSIQLNPRGE